MYHVNQCNKSWRTRYASGVDMPIYEFKCKDCDTNTEVMQKYSDAPPDCDKCDKPMTKKVSSTSFVLVGGGWYRDGYSKEGG